MTLSSPGGRWARSHGPGNRRQPAYPQHTVHIKTHGIHINQGGGGGGFDATRSYLAGIHVTDQHRRDAVLLDVQIEGTLITPTEHSFLTEAGQKR